MLGRILGGLALLALLCAASPASATLVQIDQSANGVTSAAKACTPAAATAAAIVTGGTAVTLIAGPISGGWVVNPANATRQGIAGAEAAYVSVVGAPGSTEAAANGSTDAIDVGGTYAIPPLPTGKALQANAATSGHKLSVTVCQ